LAFAKRGTKWKGENGFHHKRAIKEIMKEQAANGVNAFATLTFIRAVSRKKPLYSFKLT
jgi:hypothetical protein